MKNNEVYNFMWVGIVSSETKLTDQEEEQARIVFKKQKCFPVFMTLKEVQLFLVYYETLIRPKMHNFIELSENSNSHHTNWSNYQMIN